MEWGEHSPDRLRLHAQFLCRTLKRQLRSIIWLTTSTLPPTGTHRANRSDNAMLSNGIHAIAREAAMVAASSAAVLGEMPLIMLTERATEAAYSFGALNESDLVSIALRGLKSCESTIRSRSWERWLPVKTESAALRFAGRKSNGLYSVVDHSSIAASHSGDAMKTIVDEPTYSEPSYR